MKQKVLIFLFVLLGTLNVFSQSDTDKESGTISFVTNSSIYVKFTSTKNIAIGDTLFIENQGELMPALLVKDLSSISCVCDRLGSMDYSISMLVYAKIKKKHEEEQSMQKKQSLNLDNELIQLNEEDSLNHSKQIKTGQEESIHGRFSASAYTNFTYADTNFVSRMRYVFSVNAQNIRNSKLSAESYITFSHKYNEWSFIQDNIYNGLKVMNLSVNYKLTENANIWFGRKTNARLSSMGVIDGLQFEQKFGSFAGGIILGSRPDWQDYGFNFNLFQAGLYVSHSYKNLNGQLINSIGVIEQRNNWNIDRRFVYFQHSNSLIKNLYYMGSGEFDLYNLKDSLPVNSLRLTNLYVSIRYKPLRQLSLSVSYNARNNIIYHETYKDFINQLIEKETLQGYKFSTRYTPFNNLTMGVNLGYRFKDSDLIPSKNLYGYLSYLNIPFLKLSATAYATLLETQYIVGQVYGLRLSKDFLSGKIYSDLSYKFSNYQFSSIESGIMQQSVEANLVWKMKKNLSFTLNLETSLDSEYTNQRFYLNLTYRF